MVKVFAPSSGGNPGFRLRFQVDDWVSTAFPTNPGAEPSDAVPPDVVELTAGPGYATATRQISDVGIASPQMVKVVVTKLSGAPHPIVVEVPPTGTIQYLTATLGTPQQAGGRITWDVTTMTAASVATMSYYITLSANGCCSGTLTQASDSASLPGDYQIFVPQPLGAFDAHGLVGIPPLGIPGGDPALPGTATYDGVSTYTVTTAGDGMDNWNETNERGYLLAKRVDASHFVAEATVKWTSYPATLQYIKNALMIRRKVSGNSLCAYAYLKNPDYPATPQNRAAYNMRDSDGVLSRRATTGAASDLQPLTFRMIRQGSMVVGYQYRRGAATPGWYRLKINRYYPDTDDYFDLTTTEPVVLCHFVSSKVADGLATAQMGGLTMRTLPYVTRHIPTTVFTTQPITVSLDLRYSGTSESLTVIDNVPPDWTISNPNPAPTAVTASQVTWVLTGLTADRTLTYTATPPAPQRITPQRFYGTQQNRYAYGYVGGVLDPTPSPIAGDWRLFPPNVFLFQLGNYPSASYAASADTHLVQGTAARNNNGLNNTGSYWFLEVGNNEADQLDHRVGLLRFGLEGLSTWLNVFEAKLVLSHNRNRQPLSATHTVYVARVLRPWNAGTGVSGEDGRPSFVGEANWHWAMYQQRSWQLSGARGPADMAPPESSVQVSDATVGRFLEWDVTEMVRYWLAHPNENFGLKLTEDATVGTTSTWPLGYPNFVANDAGPDPTERPLLVIRGILTPSTRAANWWLYR